MALFFYYGWWISSQATYYQSQLGPDIRERYGFATGTPILTIENERVEVLTVYPEKQGPFHEAGFQKGDIIRSHKLTEFYKALSAADGEAAFTVVEGGDGRALELREPRDIKIPIIPAKARDQW